MRFMAQRLLSREWLTRDLPLRDYDMTANLSGAGSLSGRLPPEVNREIRHDGMRLAEDWATVIYAVDDAGSIAGHGIVTPSTEYDEATSVVCAGVSSYAQGYIYTGNRLWGPQLAEVVETDEAGNEVRRRVTPLQYPDPIAIMRDHWAWIQQQADSNIGVRIEGPETTGTRPDGVPNRPVGTYEEPYRLSRWDLPDLGSEIDTLREVAPFDFREAPRWTDATQRNVDNVIQVGYPRLGRRRTDLRFAMSENVVLTPSIQTLSMRGNHLIGIGNGDPGPSMVYVESAFSDGRVRRHRVLTDKRHSSTTLSSRLSAYRTALAQLIDITSVAVVDHPNARLSAIELGDDIRVQAEHPEYGDIDMWVRVIGISRGVNPDAAVLATANSAFYMYQPPDEEFA